MERDEQITLTAQDGSLTSVMVGRGYWTFEDLQKHLADEEVTLTSNTQNNPCRISSSKFSVGLGNIGPLLGFPRNVVIQRGLTKDSNTVSINEAIRYITVSCDLVEDRNVFHSSGDRSRVIAVLPVDTSQRLNGTTTDYGEREFTAPVRNGNFQQITFTVEDNLRRTAIKLHLVAECEFTH